MKVQETIYLKKNVDEVAKFDVISFMMDYINEMLERDPTIVPIVVMPVIGITMVFIIRKK